MDTRPASIVEFCGASSRGRVSIVFALAVGCLLGGAISTRASALTIDVGHHRLIPNRGVQEIQLLVSGAEAVSGVDLFIQVGDGGPGLTEFNLPPGTDGPSIRQVELIENTIFSGVADVPENLGSDQLDQVAVYSLALVGGISEVSADGILATVTVDTRGFFEGTWSLQLSDVLPFSTFNGPFETSFAGLAADTINNGSLTIVPPGDANRDLVVDEHDLAIWNQHRFTSGTDWDQADFNADGLTDVSDFNIWIAHRSKSTFASVPEPSAAAWALFVLSLAAPWTRRHSRP